MGRYLTATVVEDDVDWTLDDLCRACLTQREQVSVWVFEGVIEPMAGDSPEAWRFAGTALRRARLAGRLSRDLELNAPGVALALDLIERIEVLEGRLRAHPAGD